MARYRIFAGTAFPVKYWNLYLSDSVVRAKTPLAIEIDGVSYALVFNTRYSDVSPIENVFQHPGSFPEEAHVSATDLTKAINFELVDNEQVTFPNTGFFPYRLGAIGSRNPIYIQYTTSRTRLGGTNQFVEGNNFIIQNYQGQDTPTHLILNGRAFVLRLAEQTAGPPHYQYYTDQITDTAFQLSSDQLGPFGVNIRFSNGTYFNDTRSFLFQKSDSVVTTPAVIATKTLDKQSTKQWLEISPQTILQSRDWTPGVAGDAFGWRPMGNLPSGWSVATNILSGPLSQPSGATGFLFSISIAGAHYTQAFLPMDFFISINSGWLWTHYRFVAGPGRLLSLDHRVNRSNPANRQFVFV